MPISAPLSGLPIDDPTRQEAEAQGVLDADAVFVQLVCQTGPGEHDPNGTPDDRVRPSHAALHGTVWRLDDPRAPIPPMDFGCFLPDAPISGTFDGASRALYEGDAVEIRTKRGARLRVTTNHPTLSSHGLVAAGLLKNGDEVLVDPRQIVGSFLAEVDKHHRPPTAEQVFHSLLNAGPTSRASNSPHYFQGDGKSINGKIDVVGAYLFLGDDFNPKPHEVVADSDLVAGHAPGFSPFFRPGEQTLPGWLYPLEFDPSGGVGRRYLGIPTIFGHGSPLDKLLLGRGADRCPSLNQPSPDGWAGHGYPVGYGINGLPGLVVTDDGIDIGNAPRLDAVRFGLGPHFNACLYKPSSCGGSADPVFAGEVINESSGIVVFDEIVEVIRFEYSGHVYDFRSPFGHVISDGAFTSNCRCTLVHVAATGKPGAIARQILPTAPANPEAVPGLPYKDWLNDNAPGWESIADVMSRGNPAEATARGFLEAKRLGLPDGREIVRMVSQVMASPPGALSAREVAAIAAKVQAGSVALSSLPPSTQGQVQSFIAGQA